MLTEQVHRFDLFFGDPGMVDRIRDPWFRIRGGVEWKEGGAFEFSQRFRAFLPLPILERRLGIFLGTDEDEREDDPDYFDIARENPVAAGLRYFFRRHEHFDSSVSLGIRLRSGKPVAYVRPMARGRFAWKRFYFEPRQYFFWFSDDGFGTETNLGFDYSLRRNLLLRFNPGLIYSETSSGVDFYQRTSLRYLDYVLGDYPHFAVNLELISQGRTRPSTKFDHHQLRLGFRHRIWRPWLRLEYGPRLTWERRIPDEDDDFFEHWKHHIPSFVVFLEVHFEELTGPRRRN